MVLTAVVVPFKRSGLMHAFNCIFYKWSVTPYEFIIFFQQPTQTEQMTFCIEIRDTMLFLSNEIFDAILKMLWNDSSETVMSPSCDAPKTCQEVFSQQFLMHTN
ncbi:hypothetical protein XENORESO_010354 [Xenotaenia resolanae]|uniref:Uncharacterized protein n=1 Tax=Xenotaenia resolanae TaxID=208358 RepID=A0ABV0W1G6_9TELE